MKSELPGSGKSTVSRGRHWPQEVCVAVIVILSATFVSAPLWHKPAGAQSETQGPAGAVQHDFVQHETIDVSSIHETQHLSPVWMSVQTGEEVETAACAGGGSAQLRVQPLLIGDYEDILRERSIPLPDGINRVEVWVSSRVPHLALVTPTKRVELIGATVLINATCQQGDG